MHTHVHDQNHTGLHEQKEKELKIWQLRREKELLESGKAMSMD